ncbi:MAG TPA: DUF1634 domain-containing protein [Gemmataceae bacterium]|nr:DUF1634 domain-containing protein [Gemmataceae bacterium]
MTPAPPGHDERVEQMMGNLLRAGVLVAGLVVLLGGVGYLYRHGGDLADLRTFRGEPAKLRHPVVIVKDAASLRGPALIQFGVLLLIATPVLRVVFSVFAFARERDFTYVVFTLIVLAVLLGSLFLVSGSGS